MAAALDLPCRWDKLGPITRATTVQQKLKKKQQRTENNMNDGSSELAAGF
jgi:hypothetical protein